MIVSALRLIRRLKKKKELTFSINLKLNQDKENIFVLIKKTCVILCDEKKQKHGVR